MAIRTLTMYTVVCDVCGSAHDDGELSGWATPTAALAHAINYGWYERSKLAWVSQDPDYDPETVDLFCPECSPARTCSYCGHHAHPDDDNLCVNCGDEFEAHEGATLCG